MVSFVDALYSRYGDFNHFEHIHDDCELFIIGSLSPGKSGNNLILPPGLSLNSMGMSHAGPESKLRDCCHNIEQLDLSNNQFKTLDQVYKIVAHMPNLRFLNLSQNDLSHVLDPNMRLITAPPVARKLSFSSPGSITGHSTNSMIPSCSKALTTTPGTPLSPLKCAPESNIPVLVSNRGSPSSPTPMSVSVSPSPSKRASPQVENQENHLISPLLKLQSLALNSTFIPWGAINLLLQSMPNLQELHVSLNNYKRLDIGTTYPNIRRLFLSGNPDLNDPNELANLISSFPNLENLTMADCAIDQVHDDFFHFLPLIQSFNFTNWPINDWETLERLNGMKQLEEIRCQGIKLLDSFSDDDVKRYHLIARLPHFHRLNGSYIEEDERTYSEKSFVRYYLMNHHLPRPPKFFTLHAIHGRVDPIAKVDLSPPKTARVSVIYDHRSHDQEDQKETEPEVRDVTLDLNQSVKTFKHRLSSMFGLPPSQMRLYYVDPIMTDVLGPEEMRFNQKKLYTYNVQDGDKFLLDHK